MLTLPFSGVNLIAFDRRLSSTWFRRTPSQNTSSICMFCTKISKCSLLLWICGCTIFTMLSIASLRESASIFSVSLPSSIFDMSSTSLISPSRCLLDSVTFFKQSCTRMGSWIFAMAIAVMPTMPFIGVRISWLILDKNSLFAWFA